MSADDEVCGCGHAKSMHSGGVTHCMVMIGEPSSGMPCACGHYEAAKSERDEMSTSQYLRDLAKRLWGVPVMYGVDQLDAEMLVEIANSLED